MKGRTDLIPLQHSNSKALRNFAAEVKASKSCCFYRLLVIVWKTEMIDRSIAVASLVLAISTATGQVYAQDVAAGEKSFNKCRACHQVGETAKNTVGPHLNGLFGRKAGTIEGYNYSEANKSSGIAWDEGVFAEYIQNPKAKIPGTKMVFAGIKKEQEIKDLTAFLVQFGPDGKKK